MFNTINSATEDITLQLTKRFNADGRSEKISLLAEVFCDENGFVATLPSVKKAENRLLEIEKSKNYLLTEGQYLFRDNTLSLLGLNPTHEHYNVLHTPGSTGALHVIAKFILQHFPGATIWISNPTKPSHHTIFKLENLAISEYAYYDKFNKTVAFDRMMQDLTKMKKGDVLLLHACCHNPTGADLSKEQWQAVAALAKDKQIIPVFDSAYQGFARSFEEDTEGIQIFAKLDIPLFVASSFSQNFGLYNERAGALVMIFSSQDNSATVFSQLKNIAHGTYANPPAHGSNIINHILGTELKSAWTKELTAMKNRLQGIRAMLSDNLSQFNIGDYHPITKLHGLFTLLELTSEHTQTLIEKHAIYLLPTGRINIAGVNFHNIHRICRAIFDIKSTSIRH